MKIINILILLAILYNFLLDRRDIIIETIFLEEPIGKVISKPFFLEKPITHYIYNILYNDEYNLNNTLQTLNNIKPLHYNIKPLHYNIKPLHYKINFYRFIFFLENIHNYTSIINNISNIIFGIYIVLKYNQYNKLKNIIFITSCYLFAINLVIELILFPTMFNIKDIIIFICYQCESYILFLLPYYFND
jgi:hypothetical protein